MLKADWNDEGPEIPPMLVGHTMQGLTLPLSLPHSRVVDLLILCTLVNESE